MLDAPSRRAFFSPELTLALDVSSVRALVDAFAPGLALPDAPLDLARALWDAPLPAPFVEALHVVARLGTPSGRDGFVEAARDREVPYEGWREVPPQDLAARLVAGGPLHAELVHRAHRRVGRLMPERPTYERRAVEARRVTSTARVAKALSAVAGGPWSDVWIHEDDEGTVHAVLLYAAPAEAACRVEASGPVREVRRVLRADSFRHAVAEGRLAITTAHPQRVDAYARAWGEALHGEPGFFTDAPSVTLKPLLALGGAKELSRASLPEGIRDVTVVGCALHSRMGERIEARGLRSLERVTARARAGGYLTRSTMRFEVDVAPWPVDVVIELPYRVTIGAPAGSPAERLVRAELRRRGLLSPGAIADDIATLLPLVLAEWRLRELVGDEGFAAMKAAGLLVEVPGDETRRAALASMRRAGWGAAALPLPDPTAKAGSPPSHYYLMAEDPAIWAVTLRAADMAMLRLRVPKLIAKVRDELGLARGTSPALPKGVLWLGEMQLASGVVRFFYVVRAAVGDRDRAMLGKAITRAAGPFAPAVVFVPRGRKLGRDFVEVELSLHQQLGAASFRPLLEEAARGLGLLDELPIERLAPEGARILVDVARMRVYLDGEPLLRLGESGYRLVKFLAEHAEAVSKRRGPASAPPIYAITADTDAAISGHRNAEGTTRTTAFRMRASVKESLADAGKKVPREVAEEGLVKYVPGKGWRLVYPAWIKR